MTLQMCFNRLKDLKNINMENSFKGHYLKSSSLSSFKKMATLYE